MLLLAAVTLVSGCQCTKVDPDNIKYDKVMVLYSAGYNSLASYLLDDINDLKSGYIPEEKGSDVMLIVGQHTSIRYDYTVPSAAHLVRIYHSKKYGLVLDTLKTYPESTNIAEASSMREILGEVQKQFKSDHYGMIFSSHSTGWLPKGYYSNPTAYDSSPSKAGAMRAPAVRDIPAGAVPYVEEEPIPGAPPVKSIGASTVERAGVKYSYEMDITEFASALPMHFDYIIMDACLSGGIEVAYQLRDKCDILSFSQTEVLAEGLDYKKIAGHLLQGEPNVKAVADDYYQQYATQSQISDRSATISVIDCRQLAELQGVCKTLFSQYRPQIATLIPSKVQRYYRQSHHWFYDLEDILVKAGITSTERKQLESALAKCIVYKAATDAFLEAFGGFKIEMYSGFSMYLPCNGSAYLNNFYKTLDWNKATELVD